MAVHRDECVTLQQTRFVGWPIWFDRDDEEPIFLSEAPRERLAQPDRLHADAEISTTNPAVGPQAFSHLLGGFHRKRTGEAAPEVPAVDTDDAALGVDQRASREARQQLRGPLGPPLDFPPPP